MTAEHGPDAAEPDKAGVIGRFIGGVVVTVLTSPRVEAMLYRILGRIVTERVLPVIPVTVATAVSGVIEKIPGVENVRDVVGYAEDIRQRVNDLLPDIDTGIKPLDDLLDAWRPKP
ncbi:hypothetical protein KAMIYU_76 [Mycobacterium phage Kamiyu]|uniref:hypothetical protein n=1 Tax=Mycobacterium phage Akoma TaxID=1089110 RepID=UPI000232EF90|nr:hypothetical protein CM10_gp076 [Mycobacterium phage Akoma]AER48886.1 hypothetical protein AKOMA_76 [Mycobacterium phage Akoma]AER50207.1 hypothetical protein KAMIYU_76 [Mycobacterium phage Kamiyu]AWY03792.1 hypothetical protein MORTCELLUS_76 [Mycobacterium phage Mortcellus]UDG78932.1 hypothetical protein SEA_LESTYG_74 [Mycobacterium phage LestyG]